jgi:hypothetical protein
MRIWGGRSGGVIDCFCWENVDDFSSILRDCFLLLFVI